MNASQSQFLFGNDSLIFEGLLERGGGWAQGWVWMPAEPARRLTVEIMLGDQAVAAGVANLQRNDLAAGGRGDGRYGFHIALAIDESQEFHARIANSAFRLPSVVQKSDRVGGSVSRGAVDQAFGLTIKGWCWAPAEPGRTVAVRALLEGREIATATADEFRADLVTVGIGEGRHAFVLHLPPELADGRMHAISLESEDGQALMGSPVEIQAMPQGPRAVLAETRRALHEGRTSDAQQSLTLIGAYLERVEELLPQSLPWRDYEKWRPARPQPKAPEPPLVKGGLTLLSDPPGTVALLDDGADLLPGALACACAIFRKTDADILYGDAEQMTPLGLMPWFRPDWSYDLFLAQDYLRGLVLMRSDLLKTLPPSVSRTDVLMRAVEAARPGRIHHLPEVLARLGPTPPESSASLTAVADHLARRGVTGAVIEGLANGAGRRIHWPIPNPAPGISLIIPTRDRLDLLKPCIDSIRRLTRYPAYEIIVVDNQSRDADTLRYLAEGRASGAFRVLSYDAPFNFSDMNNQAAKMARGAILGFINNDVELITPDWLEQAAALLARSDVGAVGAKLRFANGMIQHAGVTLGIGGLAENAFQHLHADEPGYFGRTQVAGNYAAVTAACLFTRAESFAAIGGFDAANLPVAFNDVDLCLRLGERGLSIVWTPHIELYHHESVSRGRDASEERQARAFKEEAYMRQRWREILLNDPWYNPNLNLDGRPFTGLAFPSRHRWDGIVSSNFRLDVRSRNEAARVDFEY